MLDGLALAGRGPLGDGPAHEDDEFPDAGPLEVAEVADVRRVGQDDRVGSLGVAFQHQQPRDLHLSLSSPFLSLELSLSLSPSRTLSEKLWGDLISFFAVMDRLEELN